MKDVHGILTALSDCLCATIAEGLCWCGIYPGGQPSWDHCGGDCQDRCGMGYVTLRSANPYLSFGTPMQSMTTCDVMTQIEVAVGILRCLPVDEEPASEEKMSAIAQQLAADMQAMQEAVLCCFTGDVIVQGYEALPANGGCIGGQFVLTVDAE